NKMLSSEMWIHILAIALFCCGSADSRKVRGISSSYKRFYREKKSFLCIDGSKLIPFEQVNDDYCDCADGSDEPGTSACPHGRFYCTNLGFRPHYIPSSRVNDGICDCCDASDEYNSHARCQNTCWNLGQRERAYVEGQMRTLDEGLRLKQQLIEEGVLLWREKQAQLRELQQVAEDLQIKLEEHRRKKREADRFKEQTLRALKGGDGGKSFHLKNKTLGGILICLFCNPYSISLDEVKAEVVPVHDEERHLGDDEAMVLTTTESAKTNRTLTCVLAHLLNTNKKFTVQGIKKVSFCWVLICDLQKKLAIDYGTDWEFLFLNGQCYKLKVYEYMYTLCPFNHITQKSTAGTEVSLGLWGMWAEPAKNRYNQMIYENGEPCWQGGSRSTTVTLTCGTETALRSVKEPSKCQYIMDFQTPVACQPVLKQRGVHSEL
uniref:Glucosidase 2 subunit beta n=1 Tax=Oryzias latipes TaxID=8090 RepID=A0A3B3HDW7_ORYLA